MSLSDEKSDSSSSSVDNAVDDLHKLTLDEDGRPTVPLSAEKWGGWGESDWRLLKIRGSNYLSDRVKIHPPTPPMMKLLYFELFRCETPIFHYASRPECFIHQHRKKHPVKKGVPAGKEQKKTSAGEIDYSDGSLLRPLDDDFLFIATFHADWDPTLHVVCYFQRNNEHELQEQEQVAQDRTKKEREWREKVAKQKQEAAANDTSLGGAAASGIAQVGSVLSSLWGAATSVVTGGKDSNKNAPAPNAAEDQDFGHDNSDPSETIQTQAASDALSERVYDAQLATRARKAFDRLLVQFVQGDNSWRNNRLKLVPHAVEGGNWLVSKAVGNRPAIIGNKLDTTYYANPELNYLECCINVNSSKIGSSIFRVVKGYSVWLTIDLTFVIEGQAEDELPEAIMAGARLYKVDLSLTKEKLL